MQISKWGNSLAMRIPAEVVDILKLKEGDQIEVEILADRKFGIRRDNRKALAVEGLRKLGWEFPANFVFKREDANER